MFSQSDIFCYRIGPEPTTDAFTAVMYGENEQARLFLHSSFVLNLTLCSHFYNPAKKQTDMLLSFSYFALQPTSSANCWVKFAQENFFR